LYIGNTAGELEDHEQTRLPRCLPAIPRRHSSAAERQAGFKATDRQVTTKKIRSYHPSDIATRVSAYQ
jgi:hypothetical protein